MMEKEVLMETANEEIQEDFEYQNLSAQKLQDLYDLLLLQKKHPEFNSDIKNQLKEVSGDSIIISDNIENVKIENISILESVRQLSDSVQIMKMGFDVHSNLGISKDSLFVIIKTQQIVIDEQKLESYKLFFKKINE